MTQAQKKKYAIGLDIGGTKIEAAIVSSVGEVSHTIRIPTPLDPRILKEALCQITDDLRKLHDIVGVGLSIPGSLDPQSGILRNAPNSPSINNTDFFTQLKKNFPLDIKIENDANCLVIGEYLFGAARGLDHAVGLIMGTGFGSGVIARKQLITGSQGLAPEWGHTVIKYDGRTCHCGKRGCVETYLSGTAILTRYHSAGGSEDIKTTQDVFRTRAKDKVASKVIEETMRLFAVVIGNIVSAYDPQIIVLGGGLSLQPIYYKQQELIQKQIFGSQKTPLIKPAMFGDASGKIGAAALFF